MNLEQELNNLDREIERSTRDMNQAEGKKQAKIETLKKEFKITPKQVDKKVATMEVVLEDLVKEIETQFKELQENYSW